MSKKRVKQSAQPTSIEIPPDIALSLLKPEELEKLKRYVATHKEKYGLKDEAEARKNEESTEQAMTSITKPLLVKLQSSMVQELATSHGCTLRISEEHQGAHIVTFPVGTRLPKGDSTRPQLHLPDGYVCTLVWKDSYFHWNEETDDSTRDRKRNIKHPKLSYLCLTLSFLILKTNV